MDASLATTYTLIHSFLRKHSHTKAALAVKKAAKDIVVLKDDIEIEEPHLDTIIKEWKASQAVAARVSSSYAILFRSFMPKGLMGCCRDSSSDSDSEGQSDSHALRSPYDSILYTDSSDSSDSDSSDSSNSDDDSGDSSDTSTSASTKGGVSKPGKPQVKTTVKSKTTSSSDESSSASSDSDGSSSSDSDSESSDSDSKTIKPDQKLIKTKVAGNVKAEHQSSQTLTSGNSSSISASDREGDKTSDNSDSSDSEDDAVVKPKPAKKAALSSTKKVESRATKKNKNKEVSSSSSTSDSSSSDSDSSVVEDKPPVKVNKKRTTTTGGDATSAPATKKRRTTEDGAAVVTATTETVELPKTGPQFNDRIKANGKPARKINTPFKRVDLEKVDSQSLLQNNGYMAKASKFTYASANPQFLQHQR
ncbi:hypothetical protein C0992_006112 [Termitomyces sp. T32_za158]|nr:hypothetical protein C0992_006112 [Termitomyces sp. T32_za158]